LKRKKEIVVSVVYRVIRPGARSYDRASPPASTTML
jgi:hypothetical protein